MTVPEHELSRFPILNDLLPPDKKDRSNLVDYEIGGIALYDTSEGNKYQVWKMSYTGGEITAQPIGGDIYPLFALAGISEATMTFDRSMNPFIAYVVNGDAWIWWYDTEQGTQVHTQLPAGAIKPRCTLDDKRDRTSETSDIILAYTIGSSLYTRESGDRFGVDANIMSSPDPLEYLMTDEVPEGWELDTVGMGAGNRLLWRFKQYNGNTPWDPLTKIDLAADIDIDFTIPDIEFGQDPLLVPGIVLNLDARYPGSTPNQWDDVSGADNHYVSASESVFPVIADGEAFFDNGDVMTGPSLAALTATGGEVFMRLKNSPSYSNGGLAQFGTHTAQNHYPYSGSIYNGFGSTARKSCGVPITSLTAYHNLDVISENGFYQMLLNGINQYSTASNVSSWNSAPTIGKSAGSYYYYGWIKCILVYDHRLSPEDRAQVLAWMDKL